MRRFELVVEPKTFSEACRILSETEAAKPVNKS
jgi:hypothetical protein